MHLCLKLIHMFSQTSGKKWKEAGDRAGSLKSQNISSSWDEKMRIKAETKIFRENRAAAIETRKAKLQVSRLPQCTYGSCVFHNLGNFDEMCEAAYAYGADQTLAGKMLSHGTTGYAEQGSGLAEGAKHLLTLGKQSS